MPSMRPRKEARALPVANWRGHGQAIYIYVAAILVDWLLLSYCRAGVHHAGGSLRTLSGGRWESWKDLAIDIGIAAPFFMIWEGAAYGVHRLLWTFGPSSAKTLRDE